MSTLEDKILGEKLHNYCSSSENSDNEDSGEDFGGKKGAPVQEAKPSLPEANKWEGASTNTGPKGVIEDWRKFKQMETEKLSENQKEMTKLAEKLTMTVRTALDEEKERSAQEDPELADLLNDDFLLNYRKQRMEEMLKQTNLNKKFGELIYLRTSQEFLDAVDKEDNTVTVIIHIYENHLESCKTMNQCLEKLCKIYNSTKFCAILASRANVSRNFKVEGLPAVLVYKMGNLIGNFVKLEDDLGRTFEVEDVQGFLVEHGLLEDRNLTPALVRSSTAADKSSDDSE